MHHCIHATAAGMTIDTHEIQRSVCASADDVLLIHHQLALRTLPLFVV